MENSCDVVTTLICCLGTRYAHRAPVTVITVLSRNFTKARTKQSCAIVKKHYGKKRTQKRTFVIFERRRRAFGVVNDTLRHAIVVATTELWKTCDCVVFSCLQSFTGWIRNRTLNYCSLAFRDTLFSVFLSFFTFISFSLREKPFRKHKIIFFLVLFLTLIVVCPCWTRKVLLSRFFWCLISSR